MGTIPEGLSLSRDIISPEKEAEIIAWLDDRPWSTTLSRRTQHFGYSYDYRRKKPEPGPPMEGPVLEIAQTLERAGLMSPEQCIVNEYYRGQGIAPHVDNLGFGPVVIGVSIGADAVMVFERNTPTGPERFDLFVPRRSVMMMQGPARYEWKHSIPKTKTYVGSTGHKVTKPQDYRRISLTYRDLAKG